MSENSNTFLVQSGLFLLNIVIFSCTISRQMTVFHSCVCVCNGYICGVYVSTGRNMKVRKQPSLSILAFLVWSRGLFLVPVAFGDSPVFSHLTVGALGLETCTTGPSFRMSPGKSNSDLHKCRQTLNLLTVSPVPPPQSHSLWLNKTILFMCSISSTVYLLMYTQANYKRWLL